MNNKNILILCKVIDNYGDIGVVYRLAKSLSDIDSFLNITIVCSNLDSFKLINNDVDPLKKEQTIKYKSSVWKILDWNQKEDFKFSSEPFPIILECFQCGRPDWLENILFDKNAPKEKIYHIFNIEYLTAEEYADEFHLLKSYTRSANVKKMFFMPGFTSKTAGLIIDKDFYELLNKNKNQHTYNPNEFIVTLFSYEKDFTDIFKSLNNFQEKKRKNNSNFTVTVKAAAGKSLDFAKNAWTATGKKINLIELPFLRQEEWDKELFNSDFIFIRGEETLARACLIGKPFIWHAYKQDDDWQLVKVNALLNRLLPFIQDERICSHLKNFWNDYNNPKTSINKIDLDYILDSIDEKSALNEGFKNFADSLLKNGNLSENLLNYLTTEGL